MIDLETMATTPDAAIVAIGAVRFDPVHNKIGDTFYAVVNLQSAMDSGGRVEASTVMWWIGQTDEARAAIRKADAHGGATLERALDGFSTWAEEKGEHVGSPLLRVWGNGAAFDLPILGGAYARLGKSVPWTPWNERCYRTLSKMFISVKKPDFKGVKHNAVDDAVNQARHVCDIYAMLAEMGVDLEGTDSRQALTGVNFLAKKLTYNPSPEGEGSRIVAILEGAV